MQNVLRLRATGIGTIEGKMFTCVRRWHRNRDSDENFLSH